jgi:hypothetical protein
MTMSETRISRYMLLAPFRSKSFWIPVLAGVGLMALSSSGVGFVIGAAAVSAGVLSAVWKLTMGRNRLEREVARQIRQAAHREHRSELRELQTRFRQARDVQTGKMVRRLRDVHRRMVDIGLFSDSSGNRSTDEVREQAAQLYRSCFESLEQALNLFQKAQQIATEDLKRQLLDGRDKVLAEVRASIDSLGRSLDQIQFSSVDAELPQRELSYLRQELDQGIEVARNTEQRIQELDREVQQALQPTRER